MRDVDCTSLTFGGGDSKEIRSVSKSGLGSGLALIVDLGDSRLILPFSPELGEHRCALLPLPPPPPTPTLLALSVGTPTKKEDKGFIHSLKTIQSVDKY